MSLIQKLLSAIFQLCIFEEVEIFLGIDEYTLEKIITRAMQANIKIEQRDCRISLSRLATLNRWFLLVQPSFAEHLRAHIEPGKTTGLADSAYGPYVVGSVGVSSSPR